MAFPIPGICVRSSSSRTICSKLRREVVDRACGALVGNDNEPAFALDLEQTGDILEDFRDLSVVHAILTGPATRRNHSHLTIFRVCRAGLVRWYTCCSSSEERDNARRSHQRWGCRGWDGRAGLPGRCWNSEGTDRVHRRPVAGCGRTSDRRQGADRLARIHRYAYAFGGRPAGGPATRLWPSPGHHYRVSRHRRHVVRTAVSRQLSGVPPMAEGSARRAPGGPRHEQRRGLPRELPREGVHQHHLSGTERYGTLGGGGISRRAAYR